MQTTYSSILEKLKDSPVPLEATPESPVISGLKMKNHFHPWSITEVEFNTITNIIIENNCKSGFEVATAFGISALAAGLGFKQTGGNIITMDAYIEEQYNNCGAYREKQQTYEDADGWKSINYMREIYDLEEEITPVVGWSPDNVKSTILWMMGIEEKLDYAFIDGGHWEEQIYKDTVAISEFLGEKFVVLYHDGQGIEPGARERLSGVLGVEIKQICGMPDCWNLLGAFK